ncbi:MAG: NAD(+) synthase [Lachnospiraceae bacterium]|nr:NAD(+) synthase [Lachnospiraceae bacterium]
MKDGFIKVAVAVPAIRTADPEYNGEQAENLYRAAVRGGAKIIVFPELVLTGYTCSDLFLQDELLIGAQRALLSFAKATRGNDAIVFVGYPLSWEGKLYNTAAVVQDGRILAFIPKRFLPNYAEFYELRQFTPGPAEARDIVFDGQLIPFGSRIILDVDAIPGLEIAAEICEDAWVMNAPDIAHAGAGASVIVNLSASNETVGKDDYRRALMSSISARTISDYIYCSAGDGESTTDIVFGGRIMICENGTMLAERKIFDNAYNEAKMTFADLDIGRINFERRRMTTYFNQEAVDYLHLPVHMEQQVTLLERTFDPHPFVPSDKSKRNQRCNEILNIQSRGLAKRLDHIGCKTAVIGVSGGLDSTLAMLVTARAFDLLGMPREQITAVTMPCFGTTDRTHGNAVTLAKALGATLLEVNIKAAVMQHFADIGQDMADHDVTFENGQARERTQVIMDIANKRGGIVIGTGDLSELALGWATYNGDHMSMYGVNAGVPKTLVSHLVRYYADTTDDAVLASCLRDVLDTPVSPELLPPTGDGKIAQKTEDLVGPYELHDFFLYYMLRCGYTPGKIYRIARKSFAGVYTNDVILKWEKNFYRRFFAQQFKRSALPDGPKVGSVAVSPRGDLRMPSDASRNLWMKELEELH